MFPLQALERVVPRLRLLSRDEQLEVRDSFFKMEQKSFYLGLGLGLGSKYIYVYIYIF